MWFATLESSKNTLAELFSCARSSPEKSIGKIDAISEVGANKIEINDAPSFLIARENRGIEIVPDVKWLNVEKYARKEEILAKLEELEARFYKQKGILDRYKKSGKPRYVTRLTDEKVRELNAIACDLWRRRRKDDHSKCIIDWDWIEGKKVDCDE